MKTISIRSLFLILLAIGFIETNGQSLEKYSIILRRYPQKEEVLFDTLVPVEFLSRKDKNGVRNMQEFEGFNYPKLEYSYLNAMGMSPEETPYPNPNPTIRLFGKVLDYDPRDGVTNNSYSTLAGSVTLSNDTVKISVAITPFNSQYLKANYSFDSILFFNSRYYCNIPPEILKTNPFYPVAVVSDIKIKIKDKEYQLPYDSYRYLYNPNWEYKKFKKSTYCGINAYVVNGKIILTIDCGEGAGFFITVYIIDNNGKIIKKIEESVI